MPITITELNSATPRRIINSGPRKDPMQSYLYENILQMQAQLRNLDLDETKPLLQALERLEDKLLIDKGLKKQQRHPDEPALNDQQVVEYIQNLIESGLTTLYETCLSEKASKPVSDESTRRTLMDLSGLLSAGLDLHPEFRVETKYYDHNAVYVNIGMTESMSDHLIYKNEDDGPEFQNNSYKAYGKLEAYKQQAARYHQEKRIPKAELIDQPHMILSVDEYAKKQTEKLKDLCIKIAAHRRAVNAPRNDKSTLMTLDSNAATVQKWEEKLKHSTGFNSFLESMSFDELTALASEGHGGKLEDKFKEYVKKSPEIPADVPDEYMPTAKERCEILKKHIQSSTFANSNPNTKLAIYTELIAARAAVDSIRNNKASLNVRLSAERLHEARLQFRQAGPLKTALSRAMELRDGRVAKSAATSGHGGALEDLVRMQIREMGKTAEQNFQLSAVPERYLPTYAQRRADLKELLNSNTAELGPEQRLNLALELDRLSSGQNPDKQIGLDLAQAYQQIEITGKAFRRIGTPAELAALATAGRAGGAELRNALRSFRSAHRGLLEVAERQVELEQAMEQAADHKDLHEVSKKAQTLWDALKRFEKKHKDPETLLDEVREEPFESRAANCELNFEKYQNVPFDQLKEAVQANVTKVNNRLTQVNNNLIQERQPQQAINV